MSVWSEARRAGKQSRALMQANRVAPDIALPHAKERFEKQVCIYCCGKRGCKVGYLPITGPVVYCEDHAKQYKGDKIWERNHKLENGL